MSTFADYLENAVLNHVFRNSAMTSPSAVYLGLYTAAPSDTGGGTEVSGGGYARQAITFDAPLVAGTIENSSELTFTASGGDFGTVVAIGIFDASTAGNLLAWDTITSAEITDGGDPLRFPAGNITISLD